MKNLPLDGVIILEFCQYLSGPSAGLRLADLGARVIKIESPKGDACRKLAIENLWVEDRDSLLFHTINRNKESLTANLKDEHDLSKIKKLIGLADVMIHNFRPGVMEKLGLGFEQVRGINSKIIYTEISGYGGTGPWVKKPGQDLLCQAKSGLMYTSGNDGDPPVPFGLAVGDIICGAQAVQGILAGLIHVKQTGTGVKLELSLMESLLDFQFELLTTFYESGQLPKRSKTNNGHSLLGAPYGIHQTKDGYIAIAMVTLPKLGDAISCERLKKFSENEVFSKRDSIKKVLADHLSLQTSAYWIERLRAKDLWAMELLNWQEMRSQKGYQLMELEQKISDKSDLLTTRCPIRMDGKKLYGRSAAPELGADNERITAEFGL